MYDVIVVGGGSAGLMAAVGAVTQGANVLLLEKGEKLGRKLIISGGGRCNVTNAKEIDALIANIPGNGRFMYSAFSAFGNREIIRFFEGLGVLLKEEDHGRMFPVTDSALTVAKSLIAFIRERGVTLRTKAPVGQVLAKEGTIQGVRLRDGEVIPGRAVIVATGGKSVPRTGSTGDGYEWARELGHTITPLYPTEVPLRSDEEWIRKGLLQGLSLREIEISLYVHNGKRITTQEGDLLFTHFGLSGPAALRLGHYVSRALMKDPSERLLARIDLFPRSTGEILSREIWKRVKDDGKKTVKNSLKGFLPERMIPLFLQYAEIEGEKVGAQLSKKEVDTLLSFLKGWPVRITGTLSLAESFVTGGGVSVREIDPKTFSSRLVRGLYFAGEIMDVHGHTGGYNITVAFSSWYLAGRAAASYALEKTFAEEN
ncbi:MAG: NAD(P)/FAD-dependent oxidoreductase [Thermicanus sp.]|nr:NAD(P)/FAD-dependent oxidoreductase [Thermicanus sp.]